MRYLRLYPLFLGLYLRRIMEYRTDFGVGFAVNAGRAGMGFTLVWALFTKIQVFKGWTYSEVLFIYGLSIVAIGISTIPTPGLYRLGQDYILRGGLDRVLLRPLNPLFQIIADSIFSEGLGSLAVGCLALAIGFSGIEKASGWVSLMWLIVVIICASLMYFSIVLLSVVVCFWWDLPWGLLETTRPLGDLAQYPLDIYGSGLRFILTWVVPFGFTSFFPAATLLRPEEYRIYFFLIPAYTAVFFLISYAIWLVGLRRYVGAGH